jgi:nucleotide-binding universal stress UspA family protein
MRMDSCNIFLPYNFTVPDQKAVDFITRYFASKDNAQVVLFHAYTPLPNIDIARSTIMENMRANLSYLARRITELEAELADVAATLVTAGFGKAQVKTIFEPLGGGDLPATIAKKAREAKSDLVVVSRRASRITQFFVGSTSTRIVASLKGTAVCIVS